MKVIQWKDEYNTGIAQIDKQHRKLVQIINLLNKDDTDTGIITYAFDDLEQYVKEHFRTEEELMRMFEYDDFEAHKEEHRTFEGWLSSVRQSLNASGVSSRLLAESMNAYLRNWLIHHILDSDMTYVGKMAVALQRNGERAK